VIARNRGGLEDALLRDFCIPLESVFLVDVPNGNCIVTVTMGDFIAGTHTTIKSGIGRLMLRNVESLAGQIVKRGFSVHISNGQRHTDPFTTYKQCLKTYLNEARQRDVIPILITPVHRRYFDEFHQIIDTHTDYILAMKQLAEKEQVQLIDLAAQTKVFYEQLGIEGTKDVFMHAVPGEFRNFPNGVEDNTHFQENGAIMVANLVADGLKDSGLDAVY
jgi:fibronectin type 3 domain-containing protein